MPLTIIAERAPLTTSEHGVVRISGTRVPIETVVDDFNAGASPEEIALSYPSLDLADVYAVISYYLRHKDEVDAYIEEQDRLAAEARNSHGVDEFSRQLREQLLSRRKKALGSDPE
jgi:uncharacterized protein (DUF433 family)